MIVPLAHDRLYELLHKLIDELEGSAGYETDAYELRKKVAASFDALDCAIAAGQDSIAAPIVEAYAKITMQIKELIRMARSE